MTSRIKKPDTTADHKLKEFFDQNKSKNFIMKAGAGSGKTTSLVKALDHLNRTKGAQLRRRGQKVACITYTEIAVNEIWGDVKNAPLFHVSTIHSFLWLVVSPFQNDIKKWVIDRINEKIEVAQGRLNNKRTRQSTIPKLNTEIEKNLELLKKIPSIPRFSYGTGSDYGNGVLGHDDILKIGPYLILNKLLLTTIITQQFPYIFVDESQDTNPAIVDALTHLSKSTKENFCLGFFGDPMQKIYLSGVGTISPGKDWEVITKPENFRCSSKVLNVINKIRSEDDKLEQVPGSLVSPIQNKSHQNQGTARIFIISSDSNREAEVSKIRDWMSVNNNDPEWKLDSENSDVRILVLVHRIAARRLGFADIYSALNDKSPPHLKDGLLDGSAWVLRPFLNYVLPLALANRANKPFEVLSALRKHCPLLDPNFVKQEKVSHILKKLQKEVLVLDNMLGEDQQKTIHDVLVYLIDNNLISLDDRFHRYLKSEPESEEEFEEIESVNKFFECPASQLNGYHKYIESQSPFNTQQGIKGAEFKRVLTILDDAESDYTLFSYEKYFGTTPLSDKDEQNINEGVDSVISRTRRLFYVCCSRALQDLAVAWFTPDVQLAKSALIDRNIFPPEDIHII